MPLLKVNQIASYSGNTLTIGTTGDTVTLAAGASSSGFGATYNSGLNWTSTLVTSALTVSAGTGYFVNTSTAAITLTLPASPTFGSIVGIADYSGYASTNNITLNANGNKIQGGAGNTILTTNREAVIITYVDSTQGWVATSGVNSGTQALEPIILNVEYLVIAGGGGGGSGGAGAGGYRTGTLSNQALSTNFTLTVGAGGAGGSGSGGGNGVKGSDSVFSTITSTGGGFGADIGNVTPTGGGTGGSGGGGGAWSGPGTPGGAGNTPSTSPSQGNNGGSNGNFSSSPYPAGGGGGAGGTGASPPNGSTGGNGGAGTASSITGSSVTYAGGGGGAVYNAGTAGTGGSGGGGNGGADTVAGTSGTTNTGGGGGGGGSSSSSPQGGNGGSGIVILKYTSSLTVSNPGGGLTFTTVTSGTDKITSFTAGTGNVQWN
jgi:hypothetical protein